MNWRTLRRLAWRLLGQALSLVRYRRYANPYAAFEALPDANIVRMATAKEQEPRVLLLPIRVASTSNLLEGVIGAGLKLDGCSVFALLDGGALRYSENNTFGKSWTVANALSVYEQNRFCEAFGIEACYFDDLIDHRQLARLRQAIADLSYDQLVAFEYRGIAIGSHARAGVIRYLRQEAVDMPENTDILRAFVLTGLTTALAVEAVVRDKRITHAFLSHGIYSTWGVATCMLILEGVVVSVWGRGYVGGNFVLGRNRSYLLEGITETIEEIRQWVSERGVAKSLDAYFEAKATPGAKVDLESYYENSTTAASEKRSRVEKLTQGYKGTVCIFSNIPWDGTVFGASSYTPTLRNFAEKVVLAARQNPDLRFIARCHPAEIRPSGYNSRGTFSSFFSEDDRRNVNLTIIEPDSEISSYDLFPFCDAAMVFGTTLAMELAYRGIPVLQTGYSTLSNKGSVFEVTSDSMLQELLAQVRDGTLHMPPAMRENAALYSLYHVELCHVPDDMLQIENYYFTNYKFARAEMLAGTALRSCNEIKRLVRGEIEKCLNPYV